MVLIEEVADGGWGISGNVLTHAMLGGAAPTDTDGA
jgi:4-oxalocrotonate tautomerase